MQINGTVRNAVEGTPIAQAEVVLRIDSLVVGKFYTDDAGAFHISDASDELLGKVLSLEVSKPDFEATTLRHTLDTTIKEIKVELTPILEWPPPPPPPPPPPRSPRPPWSQWKLWSSLGGLLLVLIGVIGWIMARPPMIALFAAAPEQVAPGRRATLSWDVSSASEVRIEPDIGPVASRGSETIAPPASREYTLTARNLFGVRRASATIRVTAPRALRATVSANPTSVNVGQMTSLLVAVRDTYGAAVPGARVRLGAGGGKFTQVSGSTSAAGTFRTSWSCDPCNSGGYGIDVDVEKNGYAPAEANATVRISQPQQSTIKIVSAEIGCLDLVQNKGNLNARVKAQCEGKQACSYKAPTEAELDAMGIRRSTRTSCTQAMWITYSCSQGAGTRVEKVPGDAWKHPAAQLSCR